MNNNPHLFIGKLTEEQKRLLSHKMDDLMKSVFLVANEQAEGHLTVFTPLAQGVMLTVIEGLTNVFLNNLNEINLAAAGDLLKE